MDISSRPVGPSGPFDKLLTQIENWVAALCGATLFLVMVLVAADALGRYLFSRPIEIQYTLTEQYLMTMAILLALSWGYREGAFIRLRFFDAILSRGIKRFLDPALLLLAAIGTFLAAWYGAEIAWRAWVRGSSMFGIIDWPVWAARVWVPLGAGLLTVRLTYDALAILMQWKAPLGQEEDS